jgi:hypothetical protein
MIIYEKAVWRNRSRNYSRGRGSLKECLRHVTGRLIAELRIACDTAVIMAEH